SGKLATQFDELEGRLKNGTLLISDVKEEDEGYYMCEANNGIGASLTLPRFVLSMRRETVRRGEMATFLCEAEGDMPMEIIWRHNGARVSHVKRFHLKESSLDSSKISQLTIHHTTPEDSGKYVCIATNPFGKDETVVQLSVQVTAFNQLGPSSPSRSVSVTTEPEVPSGPPRNLAVTAVGPHALHATWDPPDTTDRNGQILGYYLGYVQLGLKNGLLKKGLGEGEEDSNGWILQGLNSFTKYKVVVQAFNNVGAGPQSSGVTATTAEAAPSAAPQEVHCSTASSRSLRVVWSPPPSYARNGVITSYRIMYENQCTPASLYTASKRHFRALGVAFFSGALMVEIRDPMSGLKSPEDDSATLEVNKLSAVLMDLEKYCNYTVRVTAMTSIGIGPWSESISCLTAEDVSVMPLRPQDVATAIALIDDGRSLRYAARTIGAPYTTVQEAVKRFRETQSYSRRPGSGRKRIISGLDDRFLFNQVLRDRHTTAVEARKRLQQVRGVTVIPEAPGAIRVALSSPRSAVVGWAPPARANGILTQYNVYEREVRHGIAKDPVRHVVSASHTHYEANQLREKSNYEWWVTAVTRVGEGPSTPVMNLAPSSRVPAAILSFSTTVSAPWRTDVRFHCRYVGNPRPELLWTFNSNRVEVGPHLSIFPNGTLHLRSATPSDAGNYSCNVQNIHHAESLVHILRVLGKTELLNAARGLPPAAPKLDILMAGWNNVTLQWTNSRASGLVDLLGYIMRYREVGGEQDVWIEKRLPRHSLSHTVTALDCGTLYEFSMSAYNMVGEGEAGATKEIRTLGDEPRAPATPDAVSSSPHALTLHLERWQDGGCPISHFVLERRTMEQNWSLVTEHAPPQASYTISELEPATFYKLRVKAFNQRGATVTELHVSTLTQKGALVLTLTTVAICLRRKPASCTDAAMPPGDNNAPVKPEYYSVLAKYDDDIYPYATFQAWKPTNQVSSQRGFQTFVYQVSDPPGVNSYAAGDVDGDEYSHVRPSMRSDTEEYDSPGSDSDGRIEDKPINFQSAYLRSNIRHNHESLNENFKVMVQSLDLTLWAFLHRCLQSHSPKKKFTSKSCNETKETAFTFPTPTPNRTPTRTPSRQRDELSEAECDRGSPFRTPMHYRV
ncbi:hypothetical protein C0J52_15119, partial [Blattella germanica]